MRSRPAHISRDTRVDNGRCALPAETQRPANAGLQAVPLDKPHSISAEPRRAEAGLQRDPHSVRAPTSCTCGCSGRRRPRRGSRNTRRSRRTRRAASLRPSSASSPTPRRTARSPPSRRGSRSPVRPSTVTASPRRRAHGACRVGVGGPLPIERRTEARPELFGSISMPEAEALGAIRCPLRPRPGSRRRARSR